MLHILSGLFYWKLILEPKINLSDKTIHWPLSVLVENRACRWCRLYLCLREAASEDFAAFPFSFSSALLKLPVHF